MNQQELFPDQKVTIDSDLKTLAKENPTECYRKLRSQGMPIGQSLYFVIEQNLETDFAKLWDEFERRGEMTYLDLSVNSIRFQVIEDDGMEISFICGDNENLIFAWSEDDVFDDAAITKIKAAIKKFCLENQHQFGLK